MRTHVVLLLVSWVLGIIVGSSVGVVTLFVIGVLLLCACAVRLRYTAQVVIALGAVNLCGVVYGAHATHVQLPECSKAVPLVGVIEAEPRHTATGARYLLSDDGCRYVVQAALYPRFHRGDTVTLYRGQFQSLAEIAQSSSGYATYLEHVGIRGSWQRGELSLVASSPPTLYSTLHTKITQIFVEPHGSLVLALLLADRGGVPAQTYDLFRRTGIAHILAVSGLHISLLAGALMLVMRWFPISLRWQRFLCIGVLWAYVSIIGAPVSATRAALFWSLALLLSLARRLISVPALVLLSLTILLTIRPQLLYRVAFQLSFAAVSGIFLGLFLWRPFRRYVPAPLRMILDALVVSISATVATTPITLFSFGYVSLIGVVLNLIVVPLVPLIMLAASSAVLVSLVSSGLATALAIATETLLACMLFVLRYASNISGATLDVSVSARGVAGWYAVLLLAVVIIMRQQRRSWRELWQ